MLEGLGVCVQRGLMLGALALIAGCSGDGPWYDTEPDPDLSYLPLGGVGYEELELGFEVAGAQARYDAYLPHGDAAPVAVVLPGAFVAKERYRWIGATLASHGVATFVAQPRTDFATSAYVTDLLTALGGDPRVDTTRLLLVGHSAGAIPHVGLTDPSACAAGFCTEDARTPRALRGLVLLGFHNQNTLADDTPMAAVESPWLVMNGTLDGLATPEKVDVTIDRIQDRPLYRIDVVGANHYQMTDYVDPERDLRLADDPEPAIGNREARATAARYLAAFARRYLHDDATVAVDLDAAADPRVLADVRLPRVEDPRDHGLPRVLSEPLAMAGLDDDANNLAITASARFGDHYYLLVRNDDTGAQVWRVAGDASAERLTFPGGHVGGFYGNRALNGLLGAMAVYRGELYVGVSSGFQGARHESTGAELWAFDGEDWRPVVSNLVDDDPALTLTGCTADPGASTATLSFTGATLDPGSAVGGVLDDIASVVDGPNVLRVVGNTAATITVQRDDVALEDELTDCAGLGAGHTMHLRLGADENGFGEPWNKAIAAMAVYEDRLYVGSGFNYADGAELMVSNDGDRFEVAIGRALLGRHDSGLPISSSISGMHVTAIGGAPALLVGTTGTDDYGARLLAIAGGEVRFVVDDSVDADDAGLDEGGMSHGLHQVVSMADYRGRLWIAVMSFSGLELFSTESPLDASRWRVEVGDGGAQPAGWGDRSQLSARLIVRSGELWMTTVSFVQHTSELADKSGLAWRTADGAAWQLVTAHAFGVNAVTVADVFDIGDQTIAATSSGSLASRASFGGLRLYTLE